jgi:hypothetical protein
MAVGFFVLYMPSCRLAFGPHDGHAAPAAWRSHADCGVARRIRGASSGNGWPRWRQTAFSFLGVTLTR